MEYNDDEINDLPFDLAIQNDKRSYCQYYISLLRTKHKLIFAFCYSRDYNSRIIKIDLFFIILAAEYSVNALFFNDSTMHNIYEKNGSFDIEYELPKIAYSFLISLGLEMLLKLLALSNNGIINLKKNKNKSKQDVKERANKLKKKLGIKFVFYFLISFILLLFFWYYVSMFGAVYSNTQIYLLKDTAISFLLSLIYPFGINLLPGFFRIPALANRRAKRNCLYQLSKIIQIF